jgi:NAD(P)-dependent dehydrogenase (short-subunit alcohol dehydrogenase family)
MDSLFDLHGRVALVTGASGGLGTRFSHVLARTGATVIAASRRRERLDELVESIHSGGGSALAVTMDVRNADSIESALDEAAGAGTIDIVVNNSGLAGGSRALDVAAPELDDIIDTNLKGAWMVAVACARRLVDRGLEGSIVNIASILGFRAAMGVAPYAVSKAGLVQMTRSLALEWARHGIRVNAIAPGYIDTDMTRAFLDSEAGQALVRRIPQRRIGQPSDLDGALLLLASQASAYMTGATIVVDGGHLQSTL